MTGHDDRGANLERRATPRVTPVASVNGVDGDSAHVVTLINISDGGLLVRSRRPAKAGDDRWFTFQVGSASASLTLSGRVRHVRPVSAADGTSFLLGLELSERLTPDQREVIAALIGEGAAVRRTRVTVR